MDLALNNLQRLICHKIKQTKPKKKNFYGARLVIIEVSALTKLCVSPKNSIKNIESS